ncbi:MAG TPA: glutathione peroxidase [Vicinamibacterales bacterium]|jgi:glutathione peroxidase
MESVYEIDATAIDGSQRSLADYRGKVLLVVNVASRCVHTPQYAGLEALYRTYKDRGLVVLGFPCDQFGHQEPGTEAEIERFCGSTYAVTFPMFAKIDVNGPNAHPLYKLLKQKKAGIIGTRFIKWNFTKFLITAQGIVLRRYAPFRRPEHVEEDIRRILT